VLLFQRDWVNLRRSWSRLYTRTTKRRWKTCKHREQKEIMRKLRNTRKLWNSEFMKCSEAKHSPIRHMLS